MNGQQKCAAPQDTRPPVVGKELSSFYESPQPCFESCTNLSRNRMEQKESSERDCCTNSDAKGIFDKSTVASSEALEEGMEHSPLNPSPPPPYKWAQSLQCLLDDMQGVELFQRFLEQEEQDTKCLEFLFACRGVKKGDPSDRERLYRLVRTIYEKKAKKIIAIKDETKREIKRKLSRTDVDIDIFDEAQHQVEMDITNTTYPSFLQSDLYIQHLRTLNEHLAERECPVSLEDPDLECLPTLHEDSELHFSEKPPVSRRESTRTKTQRAYTNQSLKMKAEIGSCLKSPYSINYGSFHARYGSFLPTSAQDSELQSLSSEAMTDDTMSQANSSLDYPMFKNKDKRPMKNKIPLMNRDSLNLHDFIPRTQRHDVDFNRSLSKQEFYDLLVKKLNRIAEEQKTKERINEKLKIIESSDCTRPEAIGYVNMKTNKPNQTVFDTTFFFAQSEENDQAILDRHVSRVFDDSGQTPILSPGCTSPPIVRPVSEVHLQSPALATSQMAQDLSYTNSQRVGLMSPFAIVPNAKPKREHDTRSNDSGAVTEWRSDDNLVGGSQDNLLNRHGSSARFTRESLKRSGRRGCSVNDSASSCVDSGISEACEPILPNVCSNLSQKSCYGNYLGTSEVVLQSFGALTSRSAMVPPHLPAQDPSSTTFPDTTTCLNDARRKLEGMKSRHACGAVRNRQSFRAVDNVEEGMSHRKQSKRSTVIAPENSSAISSNDVTVIGYSYGQGAVPYLTRFPGKNVMLKNFKSLLTKKGNFKYYFKKVENAFGTGTVLEEVSDDHAVLPLWEGKVFCVIETVDDISTSAED